MRIRNMILACMLAAICCFAGSFALADSSDFEWAKNDEGGVGITWYYGTDPEVVIPDEIDGQAVTAIGEYAFINRTDITSVKIPDTVRRIGQRAFENCPNLVSLNLPSKLVSIGSDAFINCRKLGHVTLPAKLETIGEGAFELCLSLSLDLDSKNSFLTFKDDMLIDKKEKTLIAYVGNDTHVTVPKGVVRIGEGAFACKDMLESVSLPDSVLGIGANAFHACFNLQEINLPQKLNVIEPYAFRYCLSLAHIRIPDKVTRIGSDVFNLCPILQVEIADDHKYYSVEGNWLIEKPYSHKMISETRFDTKRWNWTCNDYTLISVWGKTGSELVLPEHIDSIFMDLSDLEGLTSVTVHEGVRLLYPGVFSYHPTLQNLTVLGKDTKFFYFGSHALSNDSVTYVYKDSLAIASRENYGLPHRLVGSENLVMHVYKNSAFHKQLDELGLPYRFIGSDVTGTFESYVDENGECVITDYFGTDSHLTIPQAIDGQAVKKIEYHAFDNCNTLISLTIPEGVEILENGAFESCDNLESVSLPASLKEMNTYAFAFCGKLKEVVIAPDSNLTLIGPSAFYMCKSLQKINLPDSLVTISDNAFGWCEALESIKIPDSVTTIGGGAFSNCPKLSLSVSETESSPISSGDMLINWETGLLSGYLGKDTHIVIPDGVRVIGDNAFSSCKDIKSVVIPEGVTEIENGAFQVCTSLESVTLPSTLRILGDFAFGSCKKLTEITLPEGLVELGSTFSWCASLQKINLPETVQEVDERAFMGCDKLTLHISDTHPYFFFKDNCLVRKPTDSNSDYLFICYIGPQKEIVLPDEITEIDSYAWFDEKNLTSITLPKNLKDTWCSAFERCENLKTVIIPGMETRFDPSSFNEENYPVFYVREGSKAHEQMEKWHKDYGYTYEVFSE